MTIQQKLLNHYQKVFDILSSNPIGFEECMEVCHRKHVFGGLCWCAQHVFRLDISQEDWVVSQTMVGIRYWGIRPADTDTKPQLLCALKLRIDILTKIINN